MKYEETKEVRERDFRRLTGVTRRTFSTMVEALKRAEAQRGRNGGPKPKLLTEDMLLLALEYLGEYRTYFHIAHDFGVHETTALRICRWVEDVLIKAGTFSLPGKKAVRESPIDYEVIQIDATETPIERPKRGRSSGILGRRSGTR